MNYTSHKIKTQKDIDVYSITMRKSGFGQYYVNVEFEKDNKRQFKSVSTNDSMLFDEFYSDEQSWYENAPQAAFDLFAESL